MPGEQDQGQGLFRKAAIDKLASPEQLDVAMQVTSPLGWLALAATGVVLFVIVVWSVVGSLSVRVDGRGILLRGSAILDVISEGTGRLREIQVKPGDRVTAGQVVARIDQGELRLTLEQKRQELTTLTGQQSTQSTQNASLIEQYERQAAELRRRLVMQEKLVAQGVITRSAVLETQGALSAAEAQIAQYHGQRSESGNRLDAVQREISRLEEQLATASVVTSRHTGRVLEVLASPGDLIQSGMRVVTLEPADEPIRSVLYLPAAEGKKVRAGMTARVSPSTVKVEEYGFLVGEVKAVSDFPVTPEGLRQVLRNDKLAEALTGAGPPIQVDVTLLPDEKTPSGFKWSSSSGPPIAVQSGTLCTGSVIVERRRPISYILPIFKRALGAS
jgi:HlyD family secretion protein